ncbi:MAG: hypothetical protein Tsb0016_11000 [Sphingomonadales bacterium]
MTVIEKIGVTQGFSTLEQLRIKSKDEIRPAAEAFQRLVGEMGDLKIAVLHNIATNAPMVDKDGQSLNAQVFGWAEHDLESKLHDPRTALDSPLIAACRYESDIFWCNAEGFHSKTTTKYLDCIDLVSFERRTHVKAAIVAPVHLPCSQIGVVFYLLNDPKKTDMAAIFDQHSDALASYARTFITSYVRAMCPDQSLPPRLRLSKREVECLHWAAIGKTDNEIGMIIGRSPATIRFHIHNASQKLDTVNRPQTICKAAQLGYIALIT